MNNNVKEILVELYALDATLKTHEKELEKIIREMLASSPSVTVDRAFLARLRTRLDARAGELSRTTASPSAFAFFARPSFALGAIIAVLVVLPALSVFLRQGAQQNTHNVAVNRTGPVTLHNNAFGSLATLNTAQDTTGKMAAPMAAPASRPQSGGGGPVGIGGSGSGMVISGSAVAEPGMVMRPYEYTAYKFSYTGDALKLDETTMPVFRRASDATTAQSLAQAVQNSGIGVFDLTKLQNAHASFINLVEDRDRGYVASINLDDSSFSMYANSPKWPPMWKSDTGEKSTMPADDEILAIADSLIKTYNVDLTGYGTGKVIHNDQNVYMTAPPSPAIMMKGSATTMMPIMAPIETNVLYPLMVDGKQVLDQGGNEMGLSINVNIPLRAATGMGSIQTQKYEQSAYDAETDASKIISIAERGGIYGGTYQPEGTKVVTVDLGTPKLQLMSYSLFDEQAQRSQELYIPAYVFPIIDAGKYPNLYQKYIVVPVIKDILKNQYEVPVPMMKPMNY